MDAAYARDEDADLPEENKDFYTLKFGSKRMPGLDGFWIVDFHGLAGKSPMANPVKQYHIRSQMISTMKKDNDEGFTIYRQKFSPQSDKANELSAEPSAHFIIVIRLSLTGSPTLQQDWLASLLKQLG
ncbi:MAG TPA: DUF1214 domain-containing protein [Chitinophagaceae bacterium]|nr:DUF1214 domain-containing protein [Chitinophagaceae bacterium]